MTQPAVLLAEVTRRDERGDRELVESRHDGHLVVTRNDEVVLTLGDPGRSMYLRSAVKPVQATACLELLADSGWPGGRPSAAEVAVGWASHRAESDHLEAVRALCVRAGIDPRALTCPADRAPDGPASDQSRLHHNCSGKHAMFALAGRALGIQGAELLAIDGPLQRVLLARLEVELGGVDAVGTDGCGAPAVRAPLVGLARLFARVASESTWQDVRAAGLAHPQLVGGTGRLETALLAGGTVAKLGAEGIYGAGWTADEASWGLAVKSEDGAVRGAAAAAAAVLAAAGRDLHGWEPEHSTGGGRAVGSVVPSPDLVGRIAEVFG